ncbi:unnamed protein product [Paramecium sonneborni]|uniref:Uncharacterized protein n=1 Tax=Paramecium sonneborni TaxID=65129 RepID=A0A8S1M499_9CILI|nr:unnamed protein product [Paramecium sonneborni]
MQNNFGMHRIIRTEGDLEEIQKKQKSFVKEAVTKKKSLINLQKVSFSDHSKVKSKESIIISINKISQEKLLDLLCLSTQDLRQRFLKPSAKHEKIKIVNNKHFPRDFFNLETCLLKKNGLIMDRRRMIIIYQLFILQKELSLKQRNISEEQKCFYIIEFRLQRHQLGSEIQYLEQFDYENLKLQKSDIQVLDLDNFFDDQVKLDVKHSSINVILYIVGRRVNLNITELIQWIAIGRLNDKEHNVEWNKKRLEIRQKYNIIMIIIKTAFVQFLLVLTVVGVEMSAGPEAKIYNCANIEMIGLIGGDPLPIDTSKERYVSFQGDVRFSVKTHKQTMDSLKEGKDYFGTNSVHYSSIQNGIYIFVVEKSQENIIQTYIKTSLKRQYKQAQIPKAFYLKTIIEGDKKYAIHQIVLSDKQEMKRELFKEEKETMQSFTGLQFSKKCVIIVFATLETGTNSDFTADESFLQGIYGIMDEINKGKKCEQFFCKPPTISSLAEALSDLPVLKIQCQKKMCTYSQGGKTQVLFTKYPFLQTDKNFRSLEKAVNGMLLTTISPKNQKFVSITAQLALKCNIKDFDFHSGGYSGAFQSIKIGDQKLYSALIIEPGYNGIKRQLRTQTPELYDILEGIEKVKSIYYFMIITSKGPEELFNEIISVIDKTKTQDQEKYACTPLPKDDDISFIQLKSKLNSSQKSNQQIDSEEYEYVYEYGYDEVDDDDEFGEYEYIYEYEYEELPEELNQQEFYEEINDQQSDSIEFDQSTDDSDSDSDSEDNENQNIPQADLLEVQQNEMCFQAFSECDFQGASLKICGPTPSIPRELQNFLIQSIKMPEQMRITFYTHQQQKITIEGDQECLQRPFEIDQMRPQGQQLSHQ